MDDIIEDQIISPASRSANIGELTKALASAHPQFTAIKKTEKVAFSTTAGRRGYNYAPLDEIIEATRKGLSENGLAVMQLLKLVNANTILVTILSHSSGQWIQSESYIGKQDQPPQSEGSALTYKRRYSLSAILNVTSEEDDDAQAIEQKQPKPEALPSKSKPSAEPSSGNLPVEENKPPVDEVHEGKVGGDITEPQIKKIQATIKEKKILSDQARLYLKVNFGKEHLKELTKREASQFIEDLISDKIVAMSQTGSQLTELGVETEIEES